jgi:hypothetical protein
MIQVYDKYGKIKSSGLPGSGTVTSFSAGNFSPLFNSTVTSPTSTPNVSFSAISQAQNLFYASPNGSSGVPTFRALVAADIPTLTGYVPTSRTLTINGVTYDLSSDRSWTVTASGATWGSITGTLSAQTDLTLFLSSTYFPIPTGTITDYIDGTGAIQAFPSIPTKTSDLINDGDNGTSHFISLEDLPSTLTLYPTTAASGIGGYNKLVSSITDPSYNTVAVDVSTGAITGTDQLIAGLITDANQIVGNPGIFNMTTIGNIRKTSGSGQAEFFFRVYKRDAGGTETLILQSNNTQQITSAIYAEFFTSGLWNDGVFISTDRIVIKFYGTKVGGGSNPTYDFQFGGTSPVRSIVPVPLTVIPVLSLDELSDVVITGTPSNNSLLVYGTSSLWENKTLEQVGGAINIISDGIPGTPVTGGTTLTRSLIKSYLIPANTFASGDTFEIWAIGSKVNTNTSFYISLNINTSNTIAGATEIGRAFTNNVNITYMPFQRIYNFTTSTNLRGAVTNSGSTLETNLVGTSVSNTTFNTAVDNWILFAITPVTGGTADIMNIEKVIIRKNKYKTTV